VGKALGGQLERVTVAQDRLLVLVGARHGSLHSGEIGFNPSHWEDGDISGVLWRASRQPSVVPTPYKNDFKLTDDEKRQAKRSSLRAWQGPPSQ
jgi:hypothetical protein